jgi:hypothetical protein
VKRHGSAPDLEVISVDADGEPVPAIPPPSVTRGPSTRVLVVAFGLVVTVALVFIAWEQVQQERLLRHQECVTDAQIRYGESSAPGPLEQALAHCFGSSSAVLADESPVVLPGFVSVRLGEAKKDLALVGLHLGTVHGPEGDNVLVSSQAPQAGTSVPAGTSVDLWTGTGSG